MRTLDTVLCFSAIALTVVGCEGSGDEVTLFAAASLERTMTDAASTYEREHGARVRVVSAGSQVLRRQIEAGAPASLFVPASPEHLEAASIASLVEPPSTLACNRVVLVVRAGSRTVDLQTLPDTERLVLGAAEVPIGAYADAILDRAEARFGPAWRARVDARVVSRELDVRQVLAKVTLGEADAAIVYRTDALGTELTTLAIPDELGVVARYPIALVRDGPAPGPARRFAAWLQGEEGARVLALHGFERCPGAD